MKLVDILKEIQVQGRITPEMCDILADKINWDNCYDTVANGGWEDEWRDSKLYKAWMKTRVPNFLEFCKDFDQPTLSQIYKELQIIQKNHPKG